MELTASLGGRIVLLLPAAFCIFIILDSQDPSIRLLAVVGLIILAQIREWLLVSGMKTVAEGKKGATAKDNKH